MVPVLTRPAEELERACRRADAESAALLLAGIGGLVERMERPRHRRAPRDVPASPPPQPA